MKRDIDLIKKILINVENNVAHEAIDGYEKQDTLEHQALLIDAKLLDGKAHPNTETSKTYIEFVSISGLTPKGYDFLDSLKNDNVFNKIKNLIKDMSTEATKAYFLNFVKM